MLKAQCKHTVSKFLDKHLKILNENGHHVQKGEIEVSIKAHFRRYFSYFYEVKHKKEKILL